MLDNDRSEDLRRHVPLQVGDYLSGLAAELLEGAIDRTRNQWDREGVCDDEVPTDANRGRDLILGFAE